MKLLYCLLGLLSAGCLYAQADSCSCMINYKDLVAKTEENYIAYHQKIKGKPAEEKKYESFKAKLEKQLAGIDSQRCIEQLETYVRYFKDGHLFVAEYPRYSEQELKDFRAQIKTYKLKEPEALAYFSKHQISQSSPRLGDLGEGLSLDRPTID